MNFMNYVLGLPASLTLRIGARIAGMVVIGRGWHHDIASIQRK